MPASETLLTEESHLERLQRLEDKQAITEVLYAYAHHIDHGEREAWLDLFTETAIYRASVRRETGPELDDVVHVSGRDGLRQFIANFRPGGSTQSNFISQPLIRLAEDQAEAATYFNLMVARGGARETSSYGRYHDKLVRCTDGHWRIQERHSILASWVGRAYT
jgi:3-phenylpropionate/cinnamic acid dioxygenase small subunit